MGGEIGTRGGANSLEVPGEKTTSRIAVVDFRCRPPALQLAEVQADRFPVTARAGCRSSRPSRPPPVPTSACYEPAHSRMKFPPALGPREPEACTIAALGSRARAGKLDRIAGAQRARGLYCAAGRAVGPDEPTPPRPTTPYGRECLGRTSRSSPAGSSVATTSRRRATPPCAGGRIRTSRAARASVALRLPVLPVPAFADPPFSPALLARDPSPGRSFRLCAVGVDGARSRRRVRRRHVWQSTTAARRG